MDEVRIADDLVDRAELKHHKVICTPSKTFAHSSGLDQLRPEDVQYSIQHEFDQLDPIALIDPLTDTVNARADEVPLISRGATFERSRDIVGFLE